MAGRITFDANVFFYAVDARDPEKHLRAAAILRAATKMRAAFVSLQALGEFAFAAVRKQLLSRREAAAAARDFASVFAVASAEGAAFDLALSWWEEERFSYWDALLVATSVKAGATALVSEDLADGLAVAGVEIVNPFAKDAVPRLAAHGLRLTEWPRRAGAR